MKNCLVFLCVILAVVAVAKADECEIDGKTIKVGESYSEPGTCTISTCTGSNSFDTKGCSGAQALGNYEYIPQDNSKPYPACCPHFV